MITHRCACQKSYTSIIITSITWAGPRCVQEAATFLGPQNRSQGRCESISTAVVSGIQRHAQCAHVETEAAQQHQTRLQKLCDNFWSRVWFCCSRVRTNQKKVVKTTFQFQAIFPNQTLLQKDVTELAPVLSRRGALGGSLRAMMRFSVAKTRGSMCPHPPPPATK